MFRFLLRLIGVCPHASDYRERDARGQLWLVCDTCGRRVEALKRTTTERRQMRQRFRPIRPAKAKGKPATVTPFRQAGER